MSEYKDTNIGFKPEEVKPKLPWEKREDESVKAFECFCVYLLMGISRSQAKLVKEMQKKASYRAIVARWSTKYDWADRCRQYDTYLLEEDVKNRILSREKVRQELINACPKIAEVIIGLAQGKMPEDADVTPLLDKHQEVVGDRPIVSPSAIIQAVKLVLGLSGLTIPKTVEISGPDGEAIEVLQTKKKLDELTVEDLIKLREIIDG